MPFEMFMVSHLSTNQTFIAELARKGCSKINYSVMPARGPGGDVLLPPQKVPLHIRRAAKAALLRRPH